MLKKRPSSTTRVYPPDYSGFPTRESAHMVVVDFLVEEIQETMAEGGEFVKAVVVRLHDHILHPSLAVR